MQATTIGLVGPIGCGKSTAAKILRDKHGFVILSFASALRHEVAEVTLHGKEIPNDLIYESRRGNALLQELATLLGEVSSLPIDQTARDPYFKPTHAKMRRIMQLWGTEFRRDQDVNYWVNKLALDMGSFISEGRSVVCDDVRFFGNEMIFHNHWYIWDQALEEKSATGHVSERQIKPEHCHAVIRNTKKTAEDLELQISEMIEGGYSCQKN